MPERTKTETTFFLTRRDCLIAAVGDKRGRDVFHVTLTDPSGKGDFKCDLWGLAGTEHQFMTGLARYLFGAAKKLERSELMDAMVDELKTAAEEERSVF